MANTQDRGARGRPGPAPSEHDVGLVRAGRVKQAAGDLKGALADFDAAARADPGSAAAVAHRGTARLFLGDHAAAIADLTAALRIDPRLAVAYHNRATAHLALGDFATALADADEAVRLEPANIFALVCRGNARYHLSDLAAAADYREAFRLDEAATARTVIDQLAQLARKTPRAALRDCGDHLRQNPADFLSLARRGLLLLLLWRDAEAEPDFAGYRRLYAGESFLAALIAEAVRRRAADIRTPVTVCCTYRG